MPRVTLTRKHLLRGIAAVLTLGLAAAADAQCSFSHPTKARKIQLSMVPAFLGCGNADTHYETPNAVTAGGVLACAPAETYHQSAGSPSGGWRWNSTKAKGLLQIKALTSAPVHPLNPPGNTTDVAVTLKMKGIVDDQTAPASGDGYFGVFAQQTGRDRVNGDLTADLFVQLGLTMNRGSAKLKTTMDTVLNAPPLSQPGLPHCASVAIYAAGVTDPNGDFFAQAGLLLR